jgi:homoserine kinase
LGKKQFTGIIAGATSGVLGVVFQENWMAETQVRRAFAVRVPATSANLGPGFDCLGLALDLYNIITVESAQVLRLTITGEGASVLPLNAHNRVVRAMQRLCHALGRPLPAVTMRMHNAIPVARGLGSSAAAAVGGLLALNHWYGDSLSRNELLALANEIEGHPDNVAPALFGGLCVVNVDAGMPLAIKVPWPTDLRCVVYVPDASLSTTAARSVLPVSVSRADAVFNTGRAALMVAAISQRRYDYLRLATQDRLHQPYRAALIVGFDSILNAALQAGALGAFLSGAGSSIAAIADRGGETIGDAMRLAAGAAGQPGRLYNLAANENGAVVEDA